MSNISCSVRIESEIPLSQEAKSLPVDWSKAEFVSFDSIEEFESDRWNELVVDENNRLYIEFQKLSPSEEGNLKTNVDSLSIMRLDDYSGEINCHLLLPLDEEEHDFFVALQLIFIEGELKFSKVISEAFAENEERKQKQIQLSKNISRNIRIRNSNWFTLYSCYDYVADIFFSAVVKFVNLQYKLVVFLEKKLRPFQ